MPTALFTHPFCLAHDTGDYHPECADRLRAVLQILEGEDFMMLHRIAAPEASPEQILRAHSPRHFDHVRDSRPPAGRHQHLDPDTVMSEHSYEAALRAAGAGVAAVDAVMEGRIRNAFCAVRPPGHHAERDGAMGFCLLNNTAIAALHARHGHGVKKIAIVDFDVHHGNGTQDIFYDDPETFYASTHQDPAYPGTGRPNERGCAGNILNLPMPPGTGSVVWRQAVADIMLPALEDFSPDFILMSAGFDAHAADPLAHMRLTAEDFGWITKQLCELAARSCDHRVVSLLEGGYDLRALAHSVADHVRALMGLW